MHSVPCLWESKKVANIKNEGTKSIQADGIKQHFHTVSSVGKMIIWNKYVRSLMTKLLFQTCCIRGIPAKKSRCKGKLLPLKPASIPPDVTEVYLRKEREDRRMRVTTALPSFSVNLSYLLRQRLGGLAVPHGAEGGVSAGVRVAGTRLDNRVAHSCPPAPRMNCPKWSQARLHDFTNCSYCRWVLVNTARTTQSWGSWLDRQRSVQSVQRILMLF